MVGGIRGTLTHHGPSYEQDEATRCWVHAEPAAISTHRVLHGLPAGPGEEECQVALAACTSDARELEAAIAAQVCGRILCAQLGQLRQQAVAALMVPAMARLAETAVCANNVQGAHHPSIFMPHPLLTLCAAGGGRGAGGGHCSGAGGGRGAARADGAPGEPDGGAGGGGC